MTQLAQLAKPFTGKYVKPPPKGKYGDYVPHSTINERLLQVVGPFSFEVVDVIRGHAPAVGKAPSRDGAIVGALCRLTVTVDGREVVITEVGTEDNPAMGHDAENLKNAASDGLKRCAMRLGLGLHLWSQELYFLDRALAGGEGE